jgi:hypothetical protein
VLVWPDDISYISFFHLLLFIFIRFSLSIGLFVSVFWSFLWEQTANWGFSYLFFVSSNTRTMTTRKGCVRKEEAILHSKLSTLSAQYAGLIILNEFDFLNWGQFKIGQLSINYLEVRLTGVANGVAVCCGWCGGEPPTARARADDSSERTLRVRTRQCQMKFIS